MGISTERYSVPPPHLIQISVRNYHSFDIHEELVSNIIVKEREIERGEKNRKVSTLTFRDASAKADSGRPTLADSPWFSAACRQAVVSARAVLFPRLQLRRKGKKTEARNCDAIVGDDHSCDLLHSLQDTSTLGCLAI